MIYEFPNGALNTDRLVLSRDDQEVSVEPQVFDILRCLIERAGTLVTKDELIEMALGWTHRLGRDDQCPDQCRQNGAWR